MSYSYKHLYSNEMDDISNTFDDKCFMSFTIASTITSNQNNDITPEQLAQQHFRTRQAQLWYNQLSSHHGRFYTDTLFVRDKINGYTTAQLCINDLSFSKSYPTRLKSQTSEYFMHSHLNFYLSLKAGNHLKPSSGIHVMYPSWLNSISMNPFSLMTNLVNFMLNETG